MSLPVSHIIKELESPSAILPVITSLYQDKSVLSNASKSELNHICSRTLNLLNSKNPYNQWCGLNVINALIFNANVLALEGNAFFSLALKYLENMGPQNSNATVVSCINVLRNLCIQIKGKPTLTREILTPKLPALIENLIEKIALDPKNTVTFLTYLIRNHSTTFRPFGNKLYKKLINLLSTNNLPKSLQDILFACLATLPQIEKVDPEQNWLARLNGHINELCKVLLIYREFLNFEDHDITSMFEIFKLDGEDTFPNLHIDINQASSILKISDRVSLLLGLIKSFLTTATPFPVKVPIGNIIVVSDIITSINLKFLKYNRDIRDDQVKALIESTLASNYTSLVELLSALPAVYKNNLAGHISSIISFMEVMIPVKNKCIDTVNVFRNEHLFTSVLDCCVNYLKLINTYPDYTQFLQLIDMTFILLKSREGSTLHNNSNSSSKKKKSKNKDSLPLSDLLSHKHLFVMQPPKSTKSVGHRFMNELITRVNFPPTQHLRILKHIIVEAQTSLSQNEGKIPKELVDMLKNAILYPGADKLCILPIVSSLLPDDVLISVFNNPRFPVLGQFSQKVDTSNTEFEEINDEAEHLDAESKRDEQLTSEGDGDLEISHKRRKVEENKFVIDKDTVMEDDVDDNKIFKSGANEIVFPLPVTTITVDAEVDATKEKVEKELKIETKSVSQSTLSHDVVDNNESDFEMPNIEVNSDSDSDSE